MPCFHEKNLQWNGESFCLCECYSSKLFASYHIYFVFFQTQLNKNANLTQFKKQRGQKSHSKLDRFYSCHICLGHRHLIFKCYSLWDLDFQHFMAMTEFKFQILPCVKISFQSVPQENNNKPESWHFFKWTFFPRSLKIQLIHSSS